MLIKELTTNNIDLNNILRGILINESPESINNPCRDIIIRDILASKPELLVNCYKLSELNDSIKYLFNSNFDVVYAKEIVPNQYNLGLVRDLNLDKTNVEHLGIQKRFRYYFIFVSEEAKTKTICITYNPECSLKKQTSVKLESGVIKCSTLQVVLPKLKGRDLETVKYVPTTHGEIRYYDLNGGETL